jgi:hypothetical protein
MSAGTSAASLRWERAKRIVRVADENDGMLPARGGGTDAPDGPPAPGPTGRWIAEEAAACAALGVARIHASGLQERDKRSVAAPPLETHAGSSPHRPSKRSTSCRSSSISVSNRMRLAIVISLWR